MNNSLEFAFFYNNNKRRVIYFLNKLLNRRPASDPYISGDSFRALADHVIESIADINKLKNINNGNVIFCRTDLVFILFDLKLCKTERKFILITHNSDCCINNNHLHLLNNQYLIHWFAQNNTISHHKITSIPIGIENLHYYNNGRVDQFKNCSVSDQKICKILCSFNINTNLNERQAAQSFLKMSDLTDFIYIKNYLYKSFLNRYKFVASPAGNGLDCHRTWEALYLGTIPIVTGLDFYESFPNFPGLVLNSWDDVLKLDENLLLNHYNDCILRLLDSEYLWMPYWRKTIIKLKFNFDSVVSG
jgi:hypothetical protein